MGIEGISQGQRSFTPEELEALHQDASTGAIMNQVHKDAGYHEDVFIRGDDLTFRETKHEQQEHIGVVGGIELGKAAFEGIHLCEFSALEGSAAGATAMGLGIGAGAAGGLALGLYGISEAHEKGIELAQTLAKDELHVSLLCQLSLPDGYRQECLKTHELAGKSFQSASMNMAGAFATKDKALVTTLQLHADRGMNAANQCMVSGMSRDAFLKANPQIGKQLAEDAAFRNGFEGMLWAKANLSNDDFAKCERELLNRDARYLQAEVKVRL